MKKRSNLLILDIISFGAVWATRQPAVGLTDPPGSPGRRCLTNGTNWTYSICRQ